MAVTLATLMEDYITVSAVYRANPTTEHDLVRVLRAADEFITELGQTIQELLGYRMIRRCGWPHDEGLPSIVVAMGGRTKTIEILDRRSSIAELVAKVDRVMAGSVTADENYERAERLMLRAAELGYTELSDELLAVAQELRDIAERAA